jgi:hypothetical protein
MDFDLGYGNDKLGEHCNNFLTDYWLVWRHDFAQFTPCVRSQFTFKAHIIFWRGNVLIYV